MLSNRSSRSGSHAKSYQSLEERRLLAGNVTVFENIHLYIRGDADDNQFEIVADGDQLRINGLDGTTINRQESYLVTGSVPTNTGVAFEGGLRAHLGPGHDQFSVKDATFESLSIVYGGTGNDDVNVVDSRFMNRLTIQTFDGDDSISASGSHFESTFRAMTLDGEDSVTLVDSMMAGDSLVVTGNHSDMIHVEDNHYMGEVNLILPLDGDDTVQLNSPVVGQDTLGIYLGNGDDTIHADLTEASIDGKIRIGGQAGNDEAGDMEMGDEVAEDVSLGGFEHQEVFSNDVDVTGAVVSYYFGERNFYISASRLTLDQSAKVREIEWSGSYVDNQPARDDVFTIAVYEEAYYDTLWEGQYFAPTGEALASFDVGNDFGVDVNRTDTGIIIDPLRAHEPDRNVYSYSAEIDFEFEAGKNYWIAISSGISQQDFDYVDSTWEWGWQKAEENARQQTAVYVTGQDREGEWQRQWIGFSGYKRDFALRT